MGMLDVVVYEIRDRRHAEQRRGEPNEIAEAVTFLSSDRASFITGRVLSVDGGATVR